MAIDKRQFDRVTPSIKVVEGQVEWSQDVLDLINSFQSDGVDYVYDLEPQSNNLFYAGFFRESDKPSPASYQRPFFNAAYRIKTISWNGPKLTFEHDVRTHLPKMKSHEYDVSVSIGWREDAYHSVKRYHLNWMQRWYNRGFDCLRCGPQGKFRRMAVIAFHYVNAAEQSSASVIEVPVAQPIMVFDFGGLVPEGFGDWDFSSDSDGNDQLVNITYRAARVNWFYGKNITVEGGTRDKLWAQNLDHVPDVDQKQAQVWSPTGYREDNAGIMDIKPDGKSDLERLRIVRNASSYISDESSIG
jgi:hypothetical protein